MDEKNKDKLQNINSGALSSNKRRIGLPPLMARQQQAAQEQKAKEDAAIELPNRIGLLLDVSGSMAGKSIEDLKKAYDTFVAALNFDDTCLAVAHFGYSDDSAQDVPLTVDRSRIMLVGMGLHANGSTPMGRAMERIISSQPVTRCVLISDGQPDSENHAYEQANTFKEAGVPCDCVHIGHAVQGEQVLAKIAEITGGIYIKFTDTGNFAKFFSYLTPQGRLRLTSGEVGADAIGAKEIKYLGGK